MTIPTLYPLRHTHGGSGHSPTGGFFIYEDGMDKDCKEALQVTKELAVKFIEARTMSPNNFANIFPAMFDVVYKTVRECTNRQEEKEHE